MARRRADGDLVLGIVLLVMGALILLGELSVGWLVGALGILLIVLGVLVLVRVLAGGTVIGAILLVLGVLLQLDAVGVPRAIGRILDLAVGVVLVVLGVMRLRR